MIYFYVSLITYFCYCIIKYKEGIYYLEKDKYDSKKYGQRIVKNAKDIFMTPELLIIILIIIAVNFDIKVLEISTIIVYMILFLYKLKSNKKLKITKKAKTRICLISGIYVILNIWFCLDYISYHGPGLIFDNNPLYYIILYTITYLSYPVIYIANKILKPIDKKIEKAG